MSEKMLVLTSVSWLIDIERYVWNDAIFVVWMVVYRYWKIWVKICIIDLCMVVNNIIDIERYEWKDDNIDICMSIYRYWKIWRKRC